MIRIAAAVAVLLVSTAAVAATGPVRVRLTTSLGDVVLAIDREHAPRSAENFLQYVRDGFYDGTVFHRVIPGFMIQGGGLDATLRRRKTRSPVENEADNGLHNLRGTVAMARASDPQSATAQFFVNLVDNRYLDFKARTPQGWGYAVFGRVVEGMDVVDRIAQVPTTSRGHRRDVPVDPVVIERAVVEQTEQGGTQ